MDACFVDIWPLFMRTSGRLLSGHLAGLGAAPSKARPGHTRCTAAPAQDTQAAIPSFPLIAAYELLMRQVRRSAETAAPGRRPRRLPNPAAFTAAAGPSEQGAASGAAPPKRRVAGRDVRLETWRWAQDNRAEDGSLPSGSDIGTRYGRHERWGRMVKRSGLAGELGM
jgi:hypothetical protein